MGNGPLEQPLVYRAYYNGSFVNSSGTTIMFRVPPLPGGYFVGNASITITAINRFGAGPPSEIVSDEISKYFKLHNVM